MVVRQVHHDHFSRSVAVTVDTPLTGCFFGMAQQDNVEYYKRLGVEKDATHKELRNAFAKKVMTVHPDKGGDEAEFAALHNAYEVLIDERYAPMECWHGERPAK